MDPLSALACLASAAAEASPNDAADGSAGGLMPASTLLSVEVPQSVSLSSADEATAASGTATTAAMAAQHYGNMPPPVSSAGGYINGTYNSQYHNHHAQHQHQPHQYQSQSAPSTSSHHIFSYSSQHFEPEPASSSILARAAVSSHHAYQNGHGSAAAKSGLYCGSGGGRHGAGRSTYAYDHDDDTQRKPPSLVLLTRTRS